MRRGWAFSWMTVEGMQRARPRPKNVSSPFTLRVCSSDPVTAMVVDSEENRETLIIVDSSRTHSSKEYVTGRLSNLREIQPGQIWLVDVTADETGNIAWFCSAASAGSRPSTAPRTTPTPAITSSG